MSSKSCYVWDKELAGCPVRLVDARFLIGLAKRGGRLPPRQQIPDEAFIDLEHLKEMPRAEESSLQPDHPDPTGCTLCLLARGG